MSDKKSSAIKTPLAFSPIAINPRVIIEEEDDEDVISEETNTKMRKILREYEELNKLYDLCIQRIQSRNEK